MKDFGRKSALAWFDKQTLISLVLLQALWQVFAHSKDRLASWLPLVLCGHPLHLRNNSLSIPLPLMFTAVIHSVMSA